MVAAKQLLRGKFALLVIVAESLLQLELVFANDSATITTDICRRYMVKLPNPVIGAVLQQTLGPQDVGLVRLVILRRMLELNTRGTMHNGVTVSLDPSAIIRRHSQ